MPSVWPGPTSLGPIAFKGWKGQGKRNYLADEELVVSAVITAIMTGESTTILTWDNDLLDGDDTLGGQA